MPAIKSFSGYLVDPAQAQEVVSPGYDAFTPQERYEFTISHPCNYLNVTRSQDEFPENERPSLEQLLASNAANLKRLIDEGAFVYQERSCLYLYRLAVDGHEQTGVVAHISIEEYEQGRLKQHENTRAEHEDRLVQYLAGVGATSSPICVAYSQRDEIDELVDTLSRESPILDFVARDGVTHTIWRLEDDRLTTRLVEQFAAVPELYLTDGHHRSAAVCRYAANRRAENPNHTGDEPYNNLLVAMFPHDQLKISPFNRCVRDLYGHSLSEFVSSLEKSFEVNELGNDATQDPKPTMQGEISMLIDGSWYRLKARPNVVPVDDPVRAFDVVILQEQILGPVLGIHNPRSDPRLEYIPGAFDRRAMESVCDSGWRVAFATHPVAMEDLMRIADAGKVMPPKSTYFDPKMRSGIFLCML
jgi:uncharacterized protein (DUF1015 family)